MRCFTRLGLLNPLNKFLNLILNPIGNMYHLANYASSARRLDVGRLCRSEPRDKLRPNTAAALREEEQRHRPPWMHMEALGKAARFEDSCGHSAPLEPKALSDHTMTDAASSRTWDVPHSTNSP